MKKIILILLLLPFVSLAQSRKGGGERFEKIKTAKIGLITERLNLTPEQAPQFWAVYNEYESKRIELKRSIRRTMEESSTQTASDEQILSAQKQIAQLRRKELDLEEEYSAKILKTITPRQFSELKQTEAHFNKMLIEKLKEKEGN
jgi:Spy/CpxP family protein refolding chaperone